MSSLKKLFTASALLSANTVLNKLVGLVSTLVLARILMPEDFGIIAIALLVMGFFEAIKNFGGGQYLLRSKTISSDMINTAWTIGFSVSVVMATLLVAATPYLVDYFDDPRLDLVLWVYASLLVFRMLANPGKIMLQREQDYLAIVKVGIVAKVVSVILAIAAALTLRNYWALIIGQYTIAVVETIGSYFIHSHRPRFCLVNFKEQWRFSSWWLLQSILGYGKGQVDTLFVSSMFSQASLGSYHTIKYLSSFPLTYLIEPAAQPLMVQLAKIRDTGSYFIRQFSVSFIALLLLSLPMCGFMLIHHETATRIVLGDNWLEYSQLFSIFSVSILSLILSGHAYRLLVIDGNTKITFYGQLLSFVLVYGLLFSFGVTNVEEFAGLKVGIELAFSLLLFVAVVGFYISMQACLKMLFGFIPLTAAAAAAASYCSLIVPDSLPFLIYALLVGLVFSAVYLLVIVVFSLALSRVSDEWRYLKELGGKALTSMLIKIKAVPLVRRMSS